MNILVILAHPDKKSFNYAIAETVKVTLKDNGHKVIFHDLYREKFDPILSREEIPRGADIDENIKNHCRDIINADGINVSGYLGQVE